MSNNLRWLPKVENDRLGISEMLESPQARKVTATESEIKRYKPLEKNFVGKGEVRGFNFKQVEASDSGYIYEVLDTSGIKRYEVFKRIENDRFGTVSYPHSSEFGKWAWACRNWDEAVKKYEWLNSKMEEISSNNS